jgi:hypothetical protein
MMMTRMKTYCPDTAYVLMYSHTGAVAGDDYDDEDEEEGEEGEYGAEVEALEREQQQQEGVEAQPVEGVLDVGRELLLRVTGAGRGPKLL